MKTKKSYTFFPKCARCYDLYAAFIKKSSLRNAPIPLIFKSRDSFLINFLTKSIFIYTFVSSYKNKNLNHEEEYSGRQLEDE